MLFDTHAHLDQKEFDDDRDDVLSRAREAGVAGILAVGITLESSRAVAALARAHEDVHAAAGIHPNSCAEAVDGDWEAVCELVKAKEVVAIGETGLDRHWDFSPFSLQEDYFDRHLRLSQETGLPIVIHVRDCADDVMRMLREARQRGPIAGIMHSFTGDAEMAEECVGMGLHISFAGMVTFKKSDALRTVAATIPDDRILVETDAPYLSPEPRRGRRNEPAHVAHTARCVAEVRGVDFEAFAEMTTGNARRLFSVA